MIMNEQTQGVIAAARAAAPQAVQPAPQPVAQPAQPVQQPAAQQGFGGQPYQNGFATPQPVAQPEPAQQPVVATENDRTREQFDKLTGTNQRLSESNATLAQQNERLRQELLALQRTREQNNQQFAPVQQVPQQGPQQSALPKLTDYIEVDPQTGERFVNEARFNAAMSDIYQKASRAEQVVQNYVQTAEQREIERQEREAFASYPQLNPKGQSFDPKLSQQTRAIVYDSMINPQDYGGRPLGFREAADFVTGGTQPSAPAIPTPQVNAANQVQKEQAAAVVPNVPQQVTQNLDTEREYQRLVMGTRQGSDEAIAVRLLNATHRIEDVEREGGQQR